MTRTTLGPSIAALAAFLAWAISCSPCDADHTANINRLVQPLIEEQVLVGCVVGVLDGDACEVYGFGEFRRGGGSTPNGGTIYEIGSITKSFTGVLLADMVAKGELTLATPIAEMLPDGVQSPINNNQPITLLHLVTHTSGLPRLPDNLIPKDLNNPYVDYTPELMYEFLQNHKLRRPPGEYEYSNYGAGLLGALLAHQAGMTYEELVIDRIADPLNMNDTRANLSHEQLARLAPPYDAGTAPAHNWTAGATAGAGALRSNVDDLLKFLAAGLAEGDRPTRRAIRLAWEKQFGDPGVGLGWFFAPDRVTRWHDGQTGGYSSYIGVQPSQRLAVVLLCNTAADISTELGSRILQAVAGAEVRPFTFRKTVAVDPTILEKYVGEYRLTPTFVITVTLENEQLKVQGTGQSSVPFFPESPQQFFCKINDIQVTFVTGADGEVEKLILHQSGANKPAVRVAEPVSDTPADRQ